MNGGAVDARAFGGFGLVPTLLAARWRMAVNAAWRSGRERRAWTVIVALVVLGAMLVGHRLAATAVADGPAPPRDVEGVLASTLGMLAGFTAVTAVTFALSAFYFARDLDPLLVSPVPARTILLTKICVQLATGAAIGSVLALPALIAYLAAAGHVAAIPWTGLVVVSMAALPLAAGTAAVITVVRVLPARRVRDAGGLMVTLVVVGVVAVNLAVRGADGLAVTAPTPLDAGRHSLADGVWSPTGWAARSLVDAWSGDVAGALAWGLPLLVLGPLALLLCSRLCEGAFVTGFRRGQEASPGRARWARRSAVTSGPPARPAWLSIALKDLREVRRDASQLAQLLIPIALFTVYIAAPTSPSSGFGHPGRLPQWFGLSLTAAFASLFAASGLALRGVGSEGRRLWMVRTAPLGAGELLRAKCASGILVAGGLGTALLWVGGLRSHLPVGDLLPASLRVVVVVAGLCCVAVGMGAVRPRLDWTDPRRAVGIGLSFGFLGAGAGYLTLAFVIAALPYAGGPPTALGLALSDAGVVVVAMASSVVALAVGASRLRALEL